MILDIQVGGNQKLSRVVKRIGENVKLNTYWYCININVIDRMSINDHGRIHVKIVCNLALQILRLLKGSGIKTSLEAEHHLPYEDAEVTVALAACVHDIGHIVHRENHEEFSIALAPPILEEVLEGLYEEREKAIIMSEALHAVYAHKTEVLPLTLEAGVLKVADALDMEKGRARIPFIKGEVTIHSVSALSIEKVKVKRGKEKPVRINIQMSNSAGIFQLDNLLKEKLLHSGIKDLFEIEVEIEEKEKKIVEKYEI
jgi:hypothetical protein